MASSHIMMLVGSLCAVLSTSSWVGDQDNVQKDHKFVRSADPLGDVGDAMMGALSKARLHSGSANETAAVDPPSDLALLWQQSASASPDVAAAMGGEECAPSHELANVAGEIPALYSEHGKKSAHVYWAVFAGRKRLLEMHMPYALKLRDMVRWKQVSYL